MTPTRPDHATGHPGGHPGLPDLLNLRHVGGLRTADGRAVRDGVLYRCATPAFVDAEQVRVLTDEIGIRSRVDLRAPREIEQGTSPALLEAERRAVHLEVHADGSRWSFTDSVDPDWVGAYYHQLAQASGPSFVGLTRLMLEPENLPTLVHCTAGKDRTGTAVAIVLDAVGVLHEDIVTDYVRTSVAMPRLREQFRRLPAYQDRLDAVPAESFSSHPGAMRLFLRLLTEQDGGGRAYLADRGLTQGELDRLVDVLLGD